MTRLSAPPLAALRQMPLLFPAPVPPPVVVPTKAICCTPPITGTSRLANTAPSIPGAASPCLTAATRVPEASVKMACISPGAGMTVPSPPASTSPSTASLLPLDIVAEASLPTLLPPGMPVRALPPLRMKRLYVEIEFGATPFQTPSPVRPAALSPVALRSPMKAMLLTPPITRER